MKGTKLILSAIILASLAACSTGDGARKQRDFCYQEGTFHNICKTGADTTGTSGPNDNGNNNNNTTFNSELSTNLGSTFGQTVTQTLQKNLNLSPTLEIRPGYRFNVVVTKDILF